MEEMLAKDQGLVVRTRTKVDAEGRIISANYGKIYGAIGASSFPLQISTTSAVFFFNPAGNDTSLEFDDKFPPDLKNGIRLPVNPGSLRYY
jgi:hypothetical protein